MYSLATAKLVSYVYLARIKTSIAYALGQNTNTTTTLCNSSFMCMIFVVSRDCNISIALIINLSSI